MKEYRKLNGKTYKIEVFFQKGGYNFFNGREEKRGYYISVIPVERKDCGNGVVMESFVAFSGIKKLLLEVNRQSKKRYETACDMVNDELIMKLISKCE